MSMTQKQIDNLKAGDKIAYKHMPSDKPEIGVFVDIRGGYKRYFTWENGEELYLGNTNLLENCTLMLNENAEITEDMVRKVLDIYSHTDCPSFNHATDATNYIMAKLRSEKDQEYAEYLRLKAKFEK